MGLTVSAATTTNTSIELQWSDDTPGITNYKVCYHMVSYIVTIVMQVGVLKIMP